MKTIRKRDISDIVLEAINLITPRPDYDNVFIALGNTLFLTCHGNLVPRACDPWEGNEGSGIIHLRHTENCMSTELRMRCQKQNKLFEIFYCFVYKMMIFSGFWWKC